MSNIRIITDSSAGLPTEYAERYPIVVHPFRLHWDGEDFRDGVTLTPDVFYNRLAGSRTLPVSSQVTQLEYENYYRAALDAGEGVLVLPISSAMSGSYNNAMLARQQFPANAPICVLDSRLVSMPLGLMVLAAARAAAEGASLEECQQAAERAYAAIGVYFIVDTLKYLAMGGRIGGAKRLVGSALNLKPILELRDGRIEAVENVISRRKALERMFRLVERDTQGKGPLRMAVFHSAIPELAAEVSQRAQETFSPVEIIHADICSLVGMHTGPGTIAIAWQRADHSG